MSIVVDLDLGLDLDLDLNVELDLDLDLGLGHDLNVDLYQGLVLRLDLDLDLARFLLDELVQLNSRFPNWYSYILATRIRIARTIPRHGRQTGNSSGLAV